MAGQLIERSPGVFLMRVYRGREEGRRKYFTKSFRGTRAAAEKELRKLLFKKDTGKLPKPCKRTVKDFLHDWLRTAVKGTVSDRTYEDYRYRVEKYIIPAIGHFKLTDLNAEVVESFYGDLKATNLSPRSIRFIHAVLHRALERARIRENITHNPTKIAAAVLPKRCRREMSSLTAQEAKDFLQEARENKNYSLFLVLLLTGLRPNEAFGLKWDDLIDGSIRVQRALVRPKDGGWKLADTKTHRSRRPIPISSELANALKLHRKRQIEDRLKAGDQWNDHGFIFTGELGQPLHHSHVVGRHFKSILRRAGIRPLRLYDLRHSMATLLLGEGVHPKIVQERLGHASITLTMDTYSHVLPGMQEEATAKLSNLVMPFDGENGQVINNRSR